MKVAEVKEGRINPELHLITTGCGSHLGIANLEPYLQKLYPLNTSQMQILIEIEIQEDQSILEDQR